MSEKIKVGILGATGMVGQRFVTLLENHPWFELVTLAASAHSAGKTYEEAIGGRWKMETPMPEFVKNMVVKNVADVEDVVKNVDFVFSAVNMPKAEIRTIEEEYAKTETPVVSNNSAHRWTPDVPMVVPEINPEHYEVIEHQRKRLGTTHGFIAVQAYTPALAAWKEFEPREVIVSTYQAISGAGKTFNDWPEMVGNIIPFISGEEEKSEKEPLKVFGRVDEEKGEIVPFDGPLKITSRACAQRPHRHRVHQLRQEPDQGRARRSPGQLHEQGFRAWIAACAEAVHPVPDRRRSPAGQEGRGLRGWHGRFHRPSA